MRTFITFYDRYHKMVLSIISYKSLGKCALVFALVIFLAAGSAMGQGKPQGQLTPGAEPLPDEAIMAANKALDEYLGSLTVNISGDTDPNGIKRGRTIKQGLVLVQRIYMKDLANYRVWIESQYFQSDADKRKLIYKLRQDAEAVNDPYVKMQSAASGFNPLTVDRSASAEKARYDALLRDAPFEEEHGNLQRAVMLREFAKESNWGTPRWTRRAFTGSGLALRECVIARPVPASRAARPALDLVRPGTG